MRIVSPYHDFYDSALVHHDNTVIYQRIPVEIDLRKQKNVTLAPLYSEINTRFNKYLCSNYFYNSRDYINWEFDNIKHYHYPYTTMVFKGNSNFTIQQHKFLVIFCGKIYPGVEFIKVSTCDKSTTTKTLIYTNTNFLDYLSENKITLKHNKDYNHLAKYFSISGQSIEIEFLINNKITNIILESHKLLLNPQLSKVEFFKVLDVYSCYQELEMWMTGVLAYPQNMIIEVKDESKIQKHGFDQKYGFRTRPKP